MAQKTSKIYLTLIKYILITTKKKTKNTKELNLRMNGTGMEI